MRASELYSVVLLGSANYEAFYYLTGYIRFPMFSLEPYMRKRNARLDVLEA